MLGWWSESFTSLATPSMTYTSISVNHNHSRVRVTSSASSSSNLPSAAGEVSAIRRSVCWYSVSRWAGAANPLNIHRILLLRYIE